MAYKIQASFTAGELDEALHERTNLEKYKRGLKTARNWIVGKTGRVLTRPATANHIEVDEATDVKLVPIQGAGMLLVLTHNGNLLIDHETTKVWDLNIGNTYPTTDFDNLKFVEFASNKKVATETAPIDDNGGLLPILNGQIQEILTLNRRDDVAYGYRSGSANGQSFTQGVISLVGSVSSSTTSGTGYDVEYAAVPVIITNTVDSKNFFIYFLL